MICYMPFTDIEAPHLNSLTSAFGKITLYSPDSERVSERMRQWEQQGLLDIRYPGDVDSDDLSALLREYKSWAEIHQGNIGEMAGFFKSRQGRFTMMDDTNPSQIRHQIRHYGDPPGMDHVDPLRDAALFLSLAQEFDAQQYLMDREMDAVHTLEKNMMQHIAGGGADADADGALGQTLQTSSNDQALNPDMISQRVHAWSLLAQKGGASPTLCITMSQQVFEHVTEPFGGGIELYRHPLISLENEPIMPSRQIQELIQAMAHDAGGETAVPPPEAVETSAFGRRLTIHKLSGVAPRNFLKVLSGQASVEEAIAHPAQGQLHTLIGLVSGI